jgi:glycosyltransferase involved in cell wall biosynthesis
LRYREVCKDLDLLIVGTPGYRDVPAWRIPASIDQKPLVFDAFASTYDTEVLDRNNFSSGSLAAHKLRFIDRLSCSLADVILVDTPETMEFFVSELGVSKGKIHPIPIGADNSIFYPRTNSNSESDDPFRIWFHGSYIPLQGIEYIIRAAAQLEKKNVVFDIAGEGQTYDKIERLISKYNLNNVNQLGWVDYESLPEYIAQSDLCLGIFGTTGKTGRVIPNKVFEYLAMGKPVITGDSAAMRRQFNHGNDIFLCDRGNPDAIARSIESLMSNVELRNQIAESGYKKFSSSFTPEIIGAQLIDVLKTLQR